jgi:hypothetical protein
VTLQDSLDAIRATYDDLDGWHARGQKMPPEEPERGSALAADDTVFMWHRISETSRLSLLTAGEHLRLAKTSIEARQVYPSAHFTVMRTALVCASQAVWILAAKDAAERQERGLTLIGEMYTQLAKYDEEQLKLPLSASAKTELQDHLMWCQLRLSQVVGARHTRAKFIQTDVIAWALDHRFPDKRRRGAGRLLWRQMSSDAHGLGWGMYQRGSTLKADRRTGLGVGMSGGGLEFIAEPFVAIHQLLKEGWSLFDRLCEAPAS